MVKGDTNHRPALPRQLEQDPVGMGRCSHAFGLVFRHAERGMNQEELQ